MTAGEGSAPDSGTPYSGGPMGVTPPGFGRSLDYPEVPVGAILLGSARRWPERVGWIELGFSRYT